MLKKLIVLVIACALITGIIWYVGYNPAPLTTRVVTDKAGELSLILSKADGRGIKAMSLRLGDTGKLFLTGKDLSGKKIPVDVQSQDNDNIYFYQFSARTEADEFTFQARKMGVYDYTLSIADGDKTLTKNVQFIIRPRLNLQSNLHGAGDMSCGFPDTDSILVRKFCEEGIISGYPDGTFRPETIVNRAEMMKIAYQLFGNQQEIDETAANLKANNTFTFVDVEPGHWAAPYITIAKNLGKIQGYEDGTFIPFQEVKRAEAWKMMIEAAINMDLVLQPAFDLDKATASDDPWFGQYQRFGKRIGMRVPGQNDTPDWLLMAAPINRLEVVEFMNKLIYYIPTESVVLEP